MSTPDVGNLQHGPKLLEGGLRVVAALPVFTFRMDTRALILAVFSVPVSGLNAKT